MATIIITDCTSLENNLTNTFEALNLFSCLYHSAKVCKLLNTMKIFEMLFQ